MSPSQALLELSLQSVVCSHAVFCREEEERMAHIYGNIDSKTDLERVFREIRKDVKDAKSRPSLTELYKRAGYLITLTYAPSWDEKFGSEAKALREDAKTQFKTTARKINSRAKAIGTDADYDDTWGKG
jgi:hypothetical protein